MALRPLIVVLLPAMAYALLGYNCGGSGLNITTLSLLDIGKCDVENLEPVQTEVYVQLLQISDYETVTVKQCRLQIDRSVYHCGMHSHISVVTEGKKKYVKEIGAYNCQRLHETGTTAIGTAIVDRLVANATNYRSVTLAGQTFTDGRCSGTQYTDGYGTWDNVVVLATLEITLRTFTTPLKRSADKISLPSGTQCMASQGGCNDFDGTETYWTTPPADNCHFNKYNVLYEGTAAKLSPKDEQHAPEIYTVTTKDTTFALAKTTEENVCGYKIHHTEHPKLLIFETQKGRTFQTKSKVTVDNLDIFSYVNSKFVYVEKHIKNQLNKMYRDIMEQKCSLERQILQNALSLSSIAPDEMAFRIMKSPGYTAVTAGEVIYIIKCVPVRCRVRRTENCYNELPVTYQNTSYFLLPRSRIMTKTGTSRDCNDLLPNLYKIDDIWYRITTNVAETLSPPVIQPLTTPTWRYVSPDTLATSGIYTTEDLDRLRDHIMFPVEKPSMLNTLARGAMGQDVPRGSISMINLMDEDSLNHIAESAGRRLWNGFVTFGSASAGVLAIFMIGRVIKLVIDTIIHGYAIHSIYGWSLYLIGAVWSSVTNLILLLGKARKGKTKDNPENVLQAEYHAVAPPEEPDKEAAGKEAKMGHNDELSYVELRKVLSQNNNPGPSDTRRNGVYFP